MTLRLTRMLVTLGAAMWLALAGAQVRNTGILSDEQARRGDAACVRACAVHRQGCADYGKGEGQTICEDRFRGCVERCDPQRLDRNSAQVLNAKDPRMVEGPRHLQDPQVQMRICAQECGLQSSACQSGSNSNVGAATTVMGGAGNPGGACSLAMAACEDRCARQIGLKTKPERLRARTQLAVGGEGR